ncbi:hypothetical protein ABTX99_12715 [Streptomyces flaveolus]|uniref:hypothetical protein n=1 Tax=Streptomyces flaveolus TaxID=67297 RepID=UPI003327E941
MADHGGADGTTGSGQRSRLAEYAEAARNAAPPVTETARATAPGDVPPAEGPSADSASVTAARREFAALVGEFRRTAVLVPLDGDDVPLTGDHGGVRWIYAFTDEAALAGFAMARGQQTREWAYRRVLGARLLDVGVPAAGVPCGVAVDVGSDDAVLLPPVSGVVPEAVAVDADGNGDGEESR